MSSQPVFPALLFLQESGVLHFSTEAEFCCWPIDFPLGKLFYGDRLVDAAGVEWCVDAVGASAVSFWRRLRHLSRRDQYRSVEVAYQRIGRLSLDDLKNRTLARIDRDPGDVMTQSENAAVLRGPVSQAGSIREVIDYLGKTL